MPDEEPPAIASIPLIEGYALGPFATNCYLVHVPPAQDCWIIDASFAPDPMIRRIRDAGLTPRATILTHAHIDHIAGLEEVRAAFPGMQIYVHRAEESWLADPTLNLSLGFGQPFATRNADHILDGGETLELAGSSWNVIHTPGHSPGGITLYNEQAHAAIVGDTLFAGSIGRFDFPTSDETTLLRSIRESLYSLPPGTRVYPGHGPSTSIEREMAANPYIRAEPAR